MLHKLGPVIDKFEESVANICLLILVAVLGAQVVARYILSIGIPWSEEVSRFAFIWFVYISASLAVQRSTHIRVTLFVNLMPDRIRAISLVLADAIWIAFNALVIVSGIMLISRMLRHPVYSTSLMMPISYIYMVIPLAHGLMIARIIETYVRRGPTSGQPGLRRPTPPERSARGAD